MPAEPHLDPHLLRQVVATSADAIVCQDLEGTVIGWNPAASTVYGHAVADAIGMPADRLAPDEAAEVADAIARARAGHHVPRFDSHVRHRDGAVVPVSVTVSPLRDADGAVVGVATTASDISDRVRLAEELDVVRAQLEQQNTVLTRSNRDLEQFAYVASHDLSEPLRVMTGYVQQLEHRYDDVLDDRGRRYMHHIAEASTRMRSLIDDLLEYSRFLRAPRTSMHVDTAAVIDRVLRSLAGPLDRSGARVEVDVLPTVWTDAAQVESLLQNVVGNALKFVPEGRTPEVRIWGDRVDGWTRIVVDDNGIGIEPEYRDRVFRMFQRLHVREAYAGTGIGLAIAQQIVELHGGRIWVEDSPLGGARFCITLPGEARHEESRDR